VEKPDLNVVYSLQICTQIRLFSSLSSHYEAEYATESDGFKVYQIPHNRCNFPMLHEIYLLFFYILLNLLF